MHLPSELPEVPAPWEIMDAHYSSFARSGWHVSLWNTQTAQIARAIGYSESLWNAVNESIDAALKMPPPEQRAPSLSTPKRIVARTIEDLL
jgi:hypothetical protein